MSWLHIIWLFESNLRWW